MLKIFGFLALFLTTLFLITLLGEKTEGENVKSAIQEKNLILGYCQTFERYAHSLAEEHDLELIKFASSFDVLSNLKSEHIDYAIVGRRAYSYEINENILEIPLEEYGWTLVSKEKGFLEYSELEGLEINTYLEIDEAEKFFTFKPNLVFHENIDAAFENGISLISWEDFRDEFQLVVPVEGENKVEKFRTPMLYLNSEVEQLNY